MGAQLASYLRAVVGRDGEARTTLAVAQSERCRSGVHASQAEDTTTSLVAAVAAPIATAIAAAIIAAAIATSLAAAIAIGDRSSRRQQPIVGSLVERLVEPVAALQPWSLHVLYRRRSFALPGLDSQWPECEGRAGRAGGMARRRPYSPQPNTPPNLYPGRLPTQRVWARFRGCGPPLDRLALPARL